MKGRKALGAGPIEAQRWQTETTVTAGTLGRLIRLLMNVARNHPEWQAAGRIETYCDPQSGTIYRQRLRRPPPAE